MCVILKLPSVLCYGTKSRPALPDNGVPLTDLAPLTMWPSGGLAQSKSQVSHNCVHDTG